MTREELNKKAVKKLKTAIEAYDQKTCEDCISREKAIEDVVKCTDMNEDTMDVLVEKIQALPPVRPARRKGKWILVENGWNTVCDCCGKGKWKGYIPTPEEATEWMPICPQCGADMIEGEKDEPDTKKN